MSGEFSILRERGQHVGGGLMAWWVCRSERFLREIFCRYKRTGGAKEKAPFRDARMRCERYHEHKSTDRCVFVEK